MRSNVGSCDKVFRSVVGVLIIGIGFYFQNWWGAIGAIPILTAFVNWCPLYTVFGINTCATAKE